METRRVDQDRKLWKYIIFSALTCGIYGLYFMYTLVKDLNTACGYKETDEDKMSPNYIIVVLLTCVTCGIYAYYWWYKQGNRIKTAGREYGINIEDNGSTYLLWFLVGVLLCGFGPLIGMHIFLKNLNLVCKAYNDETQGGADQYAANFNSSTDYQNNYSQNNNNQWDAPAQNKSNPWDTPVQNNSNPWDAPVQNNSNPWDAPAQNNSNPWDAPAQDNSNPWDAPAQNSVKPSDPWSTPAQNDSKPSDPWSTPAQNDSKPSDPWSTPAQNDNKPSDPWSTPAQNDSKPSDPWSTGADSGRVSLSKSSAPEKQTDFVDLENELTTFPEDEKTIGADVFGTIVGTVGTFEGQSFPIYDGEVLVIGRNSQMSQLVIPSPDISRKHCAVRYSGAENAYYVTDYSSVGTFCKGGGRIPAGQEIKYEAGTEISLGSGKNAFLLK